MTGDRILLTDEDGHYTARAWRRSKGVGMDTETRDGLYAWVRSKLPSRLCVLMEMTHTMAEVLELIDAAQDAVAEVSHG